MDVTFFETPAALRRWLRAHHATAAELHVGFHTKASGLGGLTYQEALDEALCWGWIDGVRRKVDADSYTNRFTPRRPGSTWSPTNLGHVARLLAAGRMCRPGLAAFEAQRSAPPARPAGPRAGRAGRGRGPVSAAAGTRRTSRGRSRSGG